MSLVSVGAEIAGLTVMLIGLAQRIGVENCNLSVNDEEENACRKKADAAESKYLAMTVSGAVTLGVGFTAMLVSFLINPHPVPLDEQRELADRYNKKWRQRLGLEDSEAESERRLSSDLNRKRKPRPTAAPLLCPDVAGISIGLAF